MLIKKCKHFVEMINNQSAVLFTRQMRNCLLLQPPQRHRATNSFTTLSGVLSMMLLLLSCCGVDAIGYSYTRFIGPVTGPERKIFVNNENDGKTQTRATDALRLDYVGKPEYEFAYGVEDADAKILHNRNEVRNGDAVKGVYSLIDPDGTLRVVKYTADEINGFQAEVVRNGVSSLHGQKQHDYSHVPPSKVTFNNHFKPNYHHQYPQSQANLNGDRFTQYPSFNTYKPNLGQVSQLKHETPPQAPIIYHYNKNYDDYEDGNGDNNKRNNESDSDYRQDQQPQYEVHERPNEDHQKKQDQQPQYEVHEKPDEDTQENQDYDLNNQDGSGYKSDKHIEIASHKKKKHHVDEDDDDDDDDDDEDDYDDSEELDDYDETVHPTHNSEESYEYY